MLILLQHRVYLSIAAASGMAQDLSMALEPGAFLFEQIHQSGVVIVPAAPLQIIRFSALGRNLDFYCGSNHIMIPVSTVSDILDNNGSANIVCSSMSCRLSIQGSPDQYQNQLLQIISKLQELCSLPRQDSSQAQSDSPTEFTTIRPPKVPKEFTTESVKHSPADNETSNPIPPKHNESRNQKQEQEVAQPKKHHSEKEVRELIDYAAIAHTFQASYVLEKIVEAETERIQREKSGWRVAGAIAGLALGASDGFQVTDLFTSMAFSNIGSMAHEFASKEQVEFLMKIKSEWLVSHKSFLEICHRLGPPRQRTICYFSKTGQVFIANLHENPSRGIFLVPMDKAKDHALGFKNEDSLQVLYNNFDQADIDILAMQLHPTELVELGSQKRISSSKAATLNPYHELLSQFDQISQLTVKGESFPVIAYKVPIPVSSEY